MILKFDTFEIDMKDKLTKRFALLEIADLAARIEENPWDFVLLEKLYTVFFTNFVNSIKKADGVILYDSKAICDFLSDYEFVNEYEIQKIVEEAKNVQTKSLEERARVAEELKKKSE